MEYEDFLRVCPKKDGSLLSERTVQHYVGGLQTTSDDMMRIDIISKPLKAMDIFELDIAIAMIYNNREFQEKDKKGKRMYSNALKHYRLYVAAFVDQRDGEDEEVKKIKENPRLTPTEKETISKARIGQGEYRKSLLDKYQSRCIITGINLPEILIASHIKPWAVSNNKERISENNGFLLSSTYDKLFDQGLISFENNGKIMLSSMISSDNAEKLKIDSSKRYDIKYVPAMKDFMNYHREVIFIK